jgi:hypothetical protein
MLLPVVTWGPINLVLAGGIILLGRRRVPVAVVMTALAVLWLLIVAAIFVPEMLSPASDFSPLVSGVQLFFGALPLIAGVVVLCTAVIGRRTISRMVHGQCVRCGYDLRARIDPTRCPECGAFV